MVTKRAGGLTIALVVLGALGVLACAETTESTLEQRARALGPASVPPAPEPPPPKLLPVSRATPPGIDPELWASLHWLPTSIHELSAFPGKAPPMVTFLREQPELQHPSCKAALDGVELMLMAEDGVSPPQTQIFFGSIDRADVEACAAVALPVFGGSMDVRGPHDEIMVFEVGHDETLAGWARLGDSTVVIVEDDPSTLDRLLAAEPDRFAAHEQLVPLLRTLEGRAPWAWSVTQADWSAVALGLPSLGTAWTMDLVHGAQPRSGRTDLTVELRYSHPTTALEAETAAHGFFAEARAITGLDLHADCRVETRDPRLACEIVVVFDGEGPPDFGKMARLLALLEHRKATHAEARSAGG